MTQNPAQPVAWMYKGRSEPCVSIRRLKRQPYWWIETPLYTRPVVDHEPASDDHQMPSAEAEAVVARAIADRRESKIVQHFHRADARAAIAAMRMKP